MGWRQIVENMHMVASTRDWFADRGRHQIYAGDRPIKMPYFLKRKLNVVSVEAGGTVATGAAVEAGCRSGCVH